MKKIIFPLLVIIVALSITIYFINGKQTIVTDNGVINTIDAINKTLKINVGEREYKIPDSFLCSTATRFYKSQGDGKLIDTNFDDLKINQNVTIKYNFLNSKVYEIIIRHAN